MSRYIVDIGSFLSGRTIEVEAHNSKEAFQKARGEVNHNRLEKIIQIRDELNRFYFDCERGFHGKN